jgi:hypothetical protein
LNILNSLQSLEQDLAILVRLLKVSNPRPLAGCKFFCQFVLSWFFKNLSYELWALASAMPYDTAYIIVKKFVF